MLVRWSPVALLQSVSVSICTAVLVKQSSLTLLIAVCLDPIISSQRCTRSLIPHNLPSLCRVQTFYFLGQKKKLPQLFIVLIFLFLNKKNRLDAAELPSLCRVQTFYFLGPGRRQRGCVSTCAVIFFYQNYRINKKMRTIKKKMRTRK